MKGALVGFLIGGIFLLMLLYLPWYAIVIGGLVAVILALLIFIASIRLWA